MDTTETHDAQGGPSFVRRVLIAMGVVTLFVAIALLLWNAVQIFLLVFVGILLAVFLGTPAHLIARDTPLPRGVALAFVIVMLVAILAGGSWLFGASVVSQVSQLVDQLPDLLDRVRDVVRGLPGGSWILENVSAGQEPGGGLNMIARVTGTASLLWDILAKLVFVLFLGIFLAAAPHTYRDGAVRLFPIRSRTRAREIMDRLGHTLQGWLLGQLASMLIVGALTAVGLWLIGVPLALALGLIAGLSEFVPIVGPVLGFFPAVLLASGEGTTTVLWVLGLYLLVQQLEGNVIMPLVQRRAVELPPALTIGAVFVAGAAFGPVGLLVATPLMAVLLVLVKELYLADTLGDREAEEASSAG